MKRLFASFLTLLTLLALTAPACADVMWEPDNNSFYDRHRDQCEYENRSYYANGEEGFVTLWDAPGGSVVRSQYENGEPLRVYFLYEDWGLVARWEENGGNEISGWVPMADLYLIYDHISFEEEYGDRFRDYDGEFADYDGGAGEEFWFWEYPNAGYPRESVPVNQDMLDALRGTADTPSYISRVYTDENGNDWGYVAYMYGIRNFWILLDNPAGSETMTSSIPRTEELFASGALTAPQEPELPAQSYIPYILVAAAVAFTAGALLFFYGKRRKSAK